MPQLPLAVLVVGATCSGKSEAGRFLSHRGFRWIEPSKYLVQHVPLGMPVLERLNAVDRFFRDHGADYVAKKMLAEILQDPSFPVVVTGCRQPIERDILNGPFHTVVVGLHSSTRTRYERSKRRTRGDAAIDFPSFVRASAWEYALGLGRLIFESDEVIENEVSLTDLHFRLQELSDQLWKFSS